MNAKKAVVMTTTKGSPSTAFEIVTRYQRFNVGWRREVTERAQVTLLVQPISMIIQDARESSSQSHFFLKKFRFASVRKK